MDVEVEKPHVHHRSGHHWIDLVVPVAALFVSFVSIYIAWHHGRVMQQLVHQNERLVQANSLPFVGLDYSNGTPEGGIRMRMLATNNGVGPAHIRTAEFRVDGRPVANIRELLTACCGTGEGREIQTSTLLGKMVPAGERVAYIDLAQASETELARKFWTANRANRIVLNLCYCSVFEECWTISSLAHSQPRPVAQCPAVKVMYSE